MFAARWRMGQLMKFSDQQWSTVPYSDQFRLTRLEGNLWICIYNIMSSPICRQKYKVDEFRRSSILKVDWFSDIVHLKPLYLFIWLQLKRFFNEVLIDQLPMLEEIWRSVEQLAITECSAMDSQDDRGYLLIEQIAEIHDSMLGLDYNEIGAYQLTTYFHPSTLQKEVSPSGYPLPFSNRSQQLASYAEFFGDDLFEQRCDQCQRPADKRCSVCKQSWFCSRQCQVAYWPVHKSTCIPADNSQ